MNSPTKILLDLDGVLITNPSWRADEMAEDGYSKFNEKCVAHFNVFLKACGACEIWLSSSRRIAMSLNDFNDIFEHRKIGAPITGFTPFLGEGVSRLAEVASFANGVNEKELLIIDDDSSLHDLPQVLKDRWVATNPFQGFNDQAMKKALVVLNS